MNNASKARIVAYLSLLSLICIFSFLVAKFIIQENIDRKEIPVDTSTRI